MTRVGRPSIYVQILEKLGGAATVEDIYSYGTVTGMINCSPEGCKNALRFALRGEKIVGNLNGVLQLASIETPVPTHDPNKHSIVKFIARTNAHGGMIASLDARTDERFCDVFGQLDALKRSVFELTIEIQALKAKA